MVSVTLAIPSDVKRKMEKFSEINWSGFIRENIVQKTEELEKMELLRTQLKKEELLTELAVNAQRKTRKGRSEELRRKGLI
ncbi:MAG: hypothetical protein ABIA93_01620 [Candidatus Woesearchaeota archaeon]